MRAVCEGTVRPVFDAVAPRICLIDTSTRLIVSEVVASLCVAGCPVQVGTTGGERETRGRRGVDREGGEREAGAQ